MGPFLRSGDGKDTPVRDFREPIIPIAKIFQADLDLVAVAAELNINDGATLQTLIKGNLRLQRLALADLLKEGRDQPGGVGNCRQGILRVSTSLFRD